MERREFVGILAAGLLHATGSAAVPPLASVQLESFPANSWVVRRAPHWPLSPGAPAKHVRLIYDTDLHCVYLWGGDYCVPYPPGASGGTDRCNSHEEFWKYDINTDQWTLLLDQSRANRSGWPRGRCLAAMQGMYDSKRKGVWMLGGDERHDHYAPGLQSGGLWLFNPAIKTWTRVGDVPRMSDGGAYEIQYGVLDPVKDQLVIATNGPFHEEILHYDIAAGVWSTESWAGGPKDPVMYGIPFVFDPTRRVGWFYNWCEMSSPCVGPSKLWTYNLDTRAWTLMNTNTNVRPKATSGLAYHAKLDALVLFGGDDREEGADGLTLLNETWVYDIKKNRWWKPNLGGAIPTPRKGESLLYATAQDLLMVWGGNGFQDPGTPDQGGFVGPEVFLLKLERADPTARAS
jgi:hypothetical protein